MSAEHSKYEPQINDQVVAETPPFLYEDRDLKIISRQLKGVVSKIYSSPLDGYSLIRLQQPPILWYGVEGMSEPLNTDGVRVHNSAIRLSDLKK